MVSVFSSEAVTSGKYTLSLAIATHKKPAICCGWWVAVLGEKEPSLKTLQLCRTPS
ncbi:MAG: hypothetical protein F6K14_13375 [Symploca sp. SIO2C1]|nr:hypothetical protein [Symploca sp. SIO2C1]